MGVISKIYYADAYFRISREDAVQNGKDGQVESNSIRNQKALVEEYLRSHTDIILYRERTDDGYTGVTFERPGFQKMMEDIREEKVNCVIVKDLSRLGRNYIEAGRYIEKIFPAHGVRFISINDHIDTGKQKNVVEDMMIPFKNLLNDAYCRDISVKVRSHLDVKRKNGDFIGAFAPYGYRKKEDDKNKLLIDEEAAFVVKKVFQWKLEGMSGERIANRLNAWGIDVPMEYKRRKGEKYDSGFRLYTVSEWEAQQVNALLRNEVYTGTMLQGKTQTLNYKVKKRMRKEKKEWICCANTHKAIISTQCFELVQKLMREDTRVSPVRNKLYWFSGLVVCGSCNGNMTKKGIPSTNKTYQYLVCTEHKNKGNCNNDVHIPLGKLEQVVLKVIRMLILREIDDNHLTQLAGSEPIAMIGEEVEWMEEVIKQQKKEWEKIERYRMELYEDYKNGIVASEEYRKLREYYQNKSKRMRKSIDQLNEDKKRLENQKTETNRKKVDIMDRLTKDEMDRRWLLFIMEQIKVYDKQHIEIVFAFSENVE